MIPAVLEHLSTNGVVHDIKVVERIYSEYCENDKNEDSVIARTIFGNKPELIGIFYNLIRGTVNYKAEKIQFETELNKSFSNNAPYIFKSCVNNFVDIARDTAYGNSSKNFDSVVKEFLKCMENKK